MRTRTTQSVIAALPRAVAPVDAALLEKLFDQAPDVAFFGLTPSQFIARTRIANASQLLRETGQSIADIALACGYYDQSAFARAFRAVAGVTPTQFRGNKME